MHKTFAAGLVAGMDQRFGHHQGVNLRGKGRPAGAEHNRGAPLERQARPRRNEPCPCGSGKKWKNCCGQEVA